MALLIVNGCFDVFHEGHKNFLMRAKSLGGGCNQLYALINDDESARLLKHEKWGAKYPINDHQTRIENVRQYVDYVAGFHYEHQLLHAIRGWMPCVLVKGPDYRWKRVTGDETAPVIILDTPEPESVKEMKRRVYSNSSALK